jgi:RecA-family ATPase
LDLIELDLSEAMISQEVNKAICCVYEKWIKKYVANWEEEVSQDDLCSAMAMGNLSNKLLRPEIFEKVKKEINEATKAASQRTAWRIEGTLREFPKFAPCNLWFDYPVHHVDKVGVLKEVDAEGEQPPWKKNFTKKKTPEKRKEEKKVSLETAFEACGIDGKVTVQAMAEYMGVTEKTVRNRIKEHGQFWVDESEVGKK